jgi:precorrin-2/cobalt-factor-2 C20-methyltransferase
MPLGTLYGIGVGPGDPELITVKGLRHLQQAPVVAFPEGVAGKVGVAERIIQPWLQPQQQRLPLVFPYVQDPEVLEPAWQNAAAAVWDYLATGQDVAFACEGDISFYTTFSYLATALKQKHAEATVEAIPGVCSPLAAAAMTGLPLTQTSDRLAILPALYTVADLEAVLAWADVVVLMKVSSVYAQVWQILEQAGRLHQALVVEQATTPQQVIHRNLQQLPHLTLPYFSLMLIYKRGLNSV